MSRQTALSLIGALQAAENVTTDLIQDLNELNFGFDPGRVDGIFDYNTEQRVIDFQTFYALVDIGLVMPGEVNVSTMKSLLVSKSPAKKCQ